MRKLRYVQVDLSTFTVYYFSLSPIPCSLRPKTQFLFLFSILQCAAHARDAAL